MQRGLGPSSELRARRTLPPANPSKPVIQSDCRPRSRGFSGLFSGHVANGICLHPAFLTVGCAWSSQNHIYFVTNTASGIPMRRASHRTGAWSKLTVGSSWNHKSPQMSLRATPQAAHHELTMNSLGHAETQVIRSRSLAPGRTEVESSLIRMRGRVSLRYVPIADRSPIRDVTLPGEAGEVQQLSREKKHFSCDRVAPVAQDEPSLVCQGRFLARHAVVFTPPDLNTQSTTTGMKAVVDGLRSQVCIISHHRRAEVQVLASFARGLRRLLSRCRVHVATSFA